MAAGFGIAGRLGTSAGGRTVSQFSSTSTRSKKVSSFTSTSAATTSIFSTTLLSAMSLGLPTTQKATETGGGIRASSFNADSESIILAGGGSTVDSLAIIQRTSTGGTTMKLTPDGAASSLPSMGGTGGSMVDLMLASSRPLVEQAVGRFSEALTQPQSVQHALSEMRESVIESQSESSSREEVALERGDPSDAPDEGEIQNGPSGMTLRENEKPRILAVIEEEFRSNGTPSQITLIIKKLKSSRFTIQEYKIKKKSIFSDRDYDEGTIVRNTNIATRYVEMLKGHSKFDLMSYTDRDIVPGRVYAYKIFVEYLPNLSSEGSGKPTFDRYVDKITKNTSRESSDTPFPTRNTSPPTRKQGTGGGGTSTSSGGKGGSSTPGFSRSGGGK